MIRSSQLYIILLAILINSCIEPYFPEIPEGRGSILVVDGLISNEAGPYRVRISKSIALNSEATSYPAVTNLAPIIEVQNGPEVSLLETEPGIYETSAVIGQVGSKYRLKFVYEGDRIQSDWAELKSAAIIDSLFYQLETKDTRDKDVSLTGLQFYLNSSGTDADSPYSRYEWIETWQLGVTYPSNFDYIGNDAIVPTTDPRHTCYKTVNSVGITLSNTINYGQNKVTRFPIGFITGESERFLIKYSLQAKLFALTEEEYLYWSFIEQLNTQGASLYDIQPGNIPGNLTNLDNPDSPVLGYFSASGVSSKRVFVEGHRKLSRDYECNINLIGLLKSDLGKSYEGKVATELSKGMFFYEFIAAPTSLEPLGIYLSNPKCSDCTLLGGNLTKPDYWDE